MQQGKHAAENILRVIRGQEPKRFTFTGLGQAVSIGRRTAVAEAFGMHFTGFISWLIWRMMLWTFIPTWDRKLRLLADWLIWPLVGRDIVEMSVADGDDYEISHHIFQPGEVILEAGQVGRYVYLITEGEAEAVIETPDGDRTAALLGPGSHFGHTLRDRKVHETVRARTVVHAVTVRADQASRLQRVLAPLQAVGAAGE